MASARGFTLTEMMVVIGIIALLVAIAIPVSTALVESSKAKTTLATMKVLETAIAAFSDEKPLEHNNVPLIANDGYSTYKAVWFPFPPTPTSALTADLSKAASDPTTPNPASMGKYDFQIDDNSDYDDTESKFQGLIATYLGEDSEFESAEPPYLDIECCLLFLRKLSPRARSILESLPASVLTNEEKDGVVLQVPGFPPEPVDLFEIRDSWGNVIRYTVQPPMVDTSQTPPARICERRWELRSAGPDEQFSPTFDANGLFVTEALYGDDVVLRGP